MATSIIPKADFIVVSASQTKSVAPGAGMFYISPTIPSGYKALCPAGFDVNYSECSVNTCYLNNSQIVVQVRNNYTAELSVTVSAKLLCYNG